MGARPSALAGQVTRRDRGAEVGNGQTRPHPSSAPPPGHLGQGAGADPWCPLRTFR